MPGLRVERSQNSSGEILNLKKIPLLREKDYYIKDIGLEGDAPKQFIKAYFYEPDGTVRKRRPKTWIPYIAKSAEKWYPHESVIEYMINRIGIELGLNMNEVRLVMANDRVRFLSRYFLGKNEVLVHGAEICGEYLDDYDFAHEIANNLKTSRQLFTLEFMCRAIDNVFPRNSDELIRDLIQMITFDAIVGNNDRHFYNWGVILTIKRRKKLPKFAPIYDSARALLWNESEQNIVKHYNGNRENGKKIVNYVGGAKPRISIEGDADVNHFELVTFIGGMKPEYRSIVANLVSESNERRILKMLDLESFRHFSFESRELICYILKERFRMLRKCL